MHVISSLTVAVFHYKNNKKINDRICNFPFKSTDFAGVSAKNKIRRTTILVAFNLDLIDLSRSYFCDCLLMVFSL